MPSYAAFIGHQPAISIAELSASVPGFELQKIIEARVAVFTATADLTDSDFALLGGTIAIAEQIEGADDLANVPEVLREAMTKVKGKAIFSFRTAGLAPVKIKDLYRLSKQLLKKHGVSSRYVGSEIAPAPAIVLHENELLSGKHGAELVILADKEKYLWIGRTFAAQDIDAYTERDMKKPVRDTTVGLLPPKLAQVLLNLGEWLATNQRSASGAKPKKKSEPFIVFDPFCGTGVVPIECLIRGWTVLASDSSQKAVDGCTINLDWMRKQREIGKRDVPSTVWKQDARKAFKLKEVPDVIVTETSLGPNLKNRPTQKEMQAMKSENEELQIDFLQNTHASLPGIPLVVTWPVWFGNKTQLTLEKVLKQLPKIGYEAVLPPGVLGSQPDRPTLLYRRPNQFVGREIVLLKPL